jgi:N-methylhydantoinase B
MCFVRPVFHDGAIAAFVVIRAHQLDMGGLVPGGFSLAKKNIYENGLVLGPQLLYRGDEPVREAFATILGNVRFGEMLLPDIRTIHRCCQLGERLLVETIERYGIAALHGAMRYACDASADAMRGAVAELPDGQWEGEAVIDADGIDASEEYRVHVVVRKRRARLEVDLSGSSRQARTCVNAGALDAQTAVAIGLKLLLDPTSPFTSGLYRDIDVVVPPGTITSALPPEGAIMFYWEVQNALVHAIFAAMAQPLGPRAVAADHGTTSGHSGFGVDLEGRPWQSIAECGGEFGAWGATQAGDGESHSCIFLLNMIAASTEEVEHRAPVIWLDREYVTDSGGPGRHRGGASVRKDTLWLYAGEHHLVPLRFKYPSGVGVDGGRTGRPGGAWWFEGEGDVTDLGDVRVPAPDDFTGAIPVSGRVDPETGAPDPDGEFAYYGRHDAWREPGGSTLRVLTNAGGGWGDPLERDPDRVRRDVRDGYVTIEGAAADYGVVVTGDPHHDPEGLVVDAAATERRRGELREARA